MIGASDWVLKQLRFGVFIPWARKPREYRSPAYPMQGRKRQFILEEVNRWVRLGFVREGSSEEARNWPFLSSGFVVEGGKLRLAIDNSWLGGSIADRPFKMDTVKDLSPLLKVGDYLWKADIQDAYYHLTFRQCDRP